MTLKRRILFLLLISILSACQTLAPTPPGSTTAVKPRPVSAPVKNLPTGDLVTITPDVSVYCPPRYSATYRITSPAGHKISRILINVSLSSDFSAYNEASTVFYLQSGLSDDTDELQAVITEGDPGTSNIEDGSNSIYDSELVTITNRACMSMGTANFQVFLDSPTSGLSATFFDALPGPG